MGDLSGEQADSVFMEGLPQVSEESLAELDSDLTLEELEKALQGMECGKAPGMDGVPVDFYKSFCSEVGKDLPAVLNDSLAGGLLPVRCRRAVLMLLPKKGDLTDVKCWRPVSLLCSDYKLLSVPGCMVPLCLSAYADDLFILISRGRDIELVVNILKEFALLSSAKVDWSKSEDLLLGQWEGVPSLPDV